MDNLAEELTQELKEEKVRTFFINYFPYLLGFIILMMALISIILWRNSVNESKNEQATDIYLNYFIHSKKAGFNSLSENIMATDSQLKEFLFIIDNQFQNVKSKLLKDLLSLKQPNDVNQDNIFNLSMKEQKIVKLLHEKKINDTKILLEEILKASHIPSSMRSRLEALKVLIHEKK